MLNIHDERLQVIIATSKMLEGHVKYSEPLPVLGDMHTIRYQEFDEKMYKDVYERLKIESFATIAKDIGMSREALMSRMKSYIKKNNLTSIKELRKANKKEFTLSYEDYIMIERRLKNGDNFKAIAKDHNTSQNNIVKAVRKWRKEIKSRK